MAELPALFLSAFVAMSGAINLPPATLFGTGQQICNYQYAVPRSGDCVTYGPSLEHHLDVLQQDMDRIKLQYVSQNTVLQEELRKLRLQASTTDANLADLTKDIKSLQNDLFSMQTKVNTNINTNGGGGSTALLQQLVTTTRSQLTQDLVQLQAQMNAALGTMRADLQRDSLQQSKVDSAFQAQLRQQQQDLTGVLQRLQQLQTSITTLQQQQQQHQQSPATSSIPLATSTAAGALVSQLQADLGKLDTRVAQVEKDVQVQLPDLQKDVSRLQDVVKNQTRQLSDVKLEADFVQNNEIPQLKNDISTNYGAISQLSQTVQQTLKPLQGQVQKVAHNVTELNKQITRLGTDFFQQKVQLSRDETSISDLETQIHLQASRLSNLIKNQHFTTPRPPSTPPPTTSGFKVPTPRSSGGNAQSSLVAPTPRFG